MKVSVIGAGYLGTTHAAGMAQIGHTVLAVDTDADKIARLRSGVVPFFEPNLENLVNEGLSSGRLRFTEIYAEAAEFADVHFLTVGTPQKKQGSGADLSYVEAAIDVLCSELRRPTLIIGKSTVPVGTAQRLAERARRIAPVGNGVQLAWNPEFLREGFAVHDTLHPDRIVIGLESRGDSRSEETVRELYAPLLDNDVPLLMTDLATAEPSRPVSPAVSRRDASDGPSHRGRLGPAVTRATPVPAAVLSRSISHQLP